MAKKLYEEASVQAIANAIREKNGEASTYKIGEMAAAIRSISGGGIADNKTYNFNNPAIQAFVSGVTYTSDYSSSSVDPYTSRSDANLGWPNGVDAVLSAGVLRQSNVGMVNEEAVSEGAKTLYNYQPQKIGDYAVVSSGRVSSFGSVSASGNVRVIYGATLKNMRDIGGWTCDGGTTRYGLLYRCSELTGSGGGQQMSTADKNMLQNLLGIRAELDMRETSEDGGTGSFDSIVTYLHQAIGNYADAFSSNNIGKFKIAAEFLMNNAIQGKPSVYHCVAGADRTGTITWILLGVLGVSQSDCDKEYEITNFSGPIRLRSTYLGALYNAVNALDGDDFTNKCKNALLSCGISIALINQFRHAMIDGNPVDLAEDTPFVPQEETVANLKACTRMKWNNSTVSGKAPTANNGYLALAVTVGDTWQFTDRESNTCYGIKIPSWATKIVVSTTDASIIKWSFRSYLADGTAVGIADEDNTSGKYDVSNAEVIQISACYSTDGSTKPSWSYDSSMITVTFRNY